MTAVFTYNEKSYIGELSTARGVHFDAGTKSRVQTSGSLDVYDRIVVLNPGDTLETNGSTFKILSAVTQKGTPMTRYQLARQDRAERKY